MKKATKTIKFVRGTKGKPKLLLNGYSYFRNNGSCDRTYWLCSKNRYLKCNARIITKLNSREIVIKNAEHNHQPDTDYPVKQEIDENQYQANYN